jgi:hypothetical protein|eukprot:COSAG06_NODE_2454_length_6854_cov_1.663953_3_plen_68_part_00
MSHHSDQLFQRACNAKPAREDNETLSEADDADSGLRLGIEQTAQQAGEQASRQYLEVGVLAHWLPQR